MNSLNHYIVGWQSLLHSKKMWLGLYAVQFILALVASIPLSGYLGKTVGQSLDLKNSLGRFDYVFINDFLFEYGSGFTALLQQSLGFVFLYFLAMSFMTGGILTVVKNWKATDSLSDFFAGSGHFFGRILRLSFYFLATHALLLGLFGWIFLKVTNNMAPFELESENIIINALIAMVPIYLLLASILFMIHDLAKVILLHRDEYWLTKTIRDSYKIAFQKFLKYYPLYVLNILGLLLLTGVYIFFNELIKPNTIMQIIVVFLLGQLYLFFRLGLKIVNLSSINEAYINNKPFPPIG